MGVNLVRCSFVKLRHRVGTAEELEQEYSGIGSHDSDRLLSMSEHTCCGKVLNDDVKNFNRRVVASTKSLEIQIVNRKRSRHGVLETEAVEEESDVKTEDVEESHMEFLAAGTSNFVVPSVHPLSETAIAGAEEVVEVVVGRVLLVSVEGLGSVSSDSLELGECDDDDVFRANLTRDVRMP